MEDNGRKSDQPDEQKLAPPTGKPPFKALLARQYMAVKALADLDDPEVQEYLAGLEKVLNAPD